MSGEIVKTNERFGAIKEYMESGAVVSAIRRALPKHISESRMLQVALTAVTKQPKLLDCTPASIAKSVIEASQLGLMTDGVLGHGYLVPYGKSCTFIPGYKGLIDLARRSGQIDSIQARVVKENDVFDFAYGAEQFLVHKPAQMVGESPGKTIAAYAIARLKSGELAFDVMFWDDIQLIRKRSKAGNAGPWVTDFDEMAKKTVLRRLCKYLPLSADITEAVTKDEYAERGLLNVLIDDDGVVKETAPSLDDVFDTEADVIEAEEAPEPGDTSMTSSDPEPGASAPVDTEKKGKITDDEDAKFKEAITDIIDELALFEGGSEACNLAISRLKGVHGVESVDEIRSRAARVEFYNDLRTWATDFIDMQGVDE